MNPHHRLLNTTSNVSSTPAESPTNSPFFGKALRIGTSFSHTSTFGAKISRNPSETKGPFGLTTLYQPGSEDNSNVLVHIVFVHGLGGGSAHTWTKDSVFWPRDLLPSQDGYSNAAMHSFGYDSDFKASNILDICDFAKSLLGNMLDNPCISNSSSPIILVGHSMGGLVIKKAYILAKQGSFYTTLGDRIRSIYFIATPHQGSDHATTLSRIFRTSPSLRPYLKDLQRNSDEVKAINEEFPVHCQDLILHSFYESRPLSIPGVGKKLIVEKTNAVLSYQNERSELLNGDHRSICKFDTPEDSNYITIHRALTNTIRAITTPMPEVNRESEKESVSSSERRDEVIGLLGSFEVQESDLNRITFETVSGTCEWLTENAEFDDWVFSEGHDMLWLRGPPGAGKSFVAGYAVEQVAAMGKTVCYYFFNRGDIQKSTISSFLRSMACQMALGVPDIASLIEIVVSKSPGVVDTGDHQAVWRKLWLQGILRANGAMQDVVWVVDALDECRADGDLLKMLLRVQDVLHIKILITSRKGHDNYDHPPKAVTRLVVNAQDTQRDIAAYLDDDSPMLETNIREIILEKSNGCFLWATLVLRRLKSVHSQKGRLRAVESEPPGMDNLYLRVIEDLPDPRLSATLLTWVVCSIRPLSTAELQYALEDFREDEDSNAVRTLVAQHYYDLLFIDQHDQVRVRHASVTDFLLGHEMSGNHRRLRIDQAGGHKTIALTCIMCLNGPDMENKGHRKMRVTRPNSRSPFVSYAAHYLYEHLDRCLAFDYDIITNLAKLLQSENILSWVEYLARENSLETILRMAQALRDSLRTTAKVEFLMGHEVEVIDRWATDLVKLATKFGRQLLSYPPSIFSLILPFCPRKSAPYEQFAHGKLGMSVEGLSASFWDELVCTVAPGENNMIQPDEFVESPLDAVSKTTGVLSQGDRLRSIASADNIFAIGTSKGRISIFDDHTFLEDKVIQHPAAVTMLEFASNRHILASASHRLIRTWNTETWQSQWDIKIPKECMALAFVDDGRILLAALKNAHLLVLDLVNRTQREVDWSKRLGDHHGDKFKGRTPDMAVFQTDLDTLAVVYRGQDLVVWNYEDDTHRLYNRSRGLTGGSVQPVVHVQSLAFSHLPGSSLLVVNYFVGDLVLFDTNSGTIKTMVSTKDVYAQLTSSPDGRTFAAAAMDGTIELFDFETLQKLYRIQSEDHGITFLAFTSDSTRLLDIRGDRRSCRVWDPSVLHRREIDNDTFRNTPLYIQHSCENIIDRDIGYMPIITSLAVYGTGKHFFVGKTDGTVSIYEARQGTSVGTLLTHKTTILKLLYNEASSSIISVDNAGCLKIHHVEHLDSDWRTMQVFSSRFSGTGIQHVVLNREGSHVLVCANNEASIYLVESGERLGTAVECNRSTGFVWAAHPSCDDVLVLMSGDTMHLYSWEGLQPLTESNGVHIENVPAELSVRGVIPMFNGAMPDAFGDFPITDP
ncbi:Vegetative incompatibility protein HET-E-1 [Cytospora mali]|uniref:Vegetative incompatibility protein HET-E-1 n=1 Tax=Cytospora mali TaxID=578113 RepID=A0A194VLP4_CYTMA|nr:Vegetative incompatibility protein HET-E-1 [Valsa mali]